MTPDQLPEFEGPASVIGRMAQEVTEAAARYAAPLDRAVALELSYVQVQALQRRIRHERAAAIRVAMETMTATAVADELGISRSRLYKVLDGTENSPID